MIFSVMIFWIVSRFFVKPPVIYYSAGNNILGNRIKAPKKVVLCR